MFKCVLIIFLTII